MAVIVAIVLAAVLAWRQVQSEKRIMAAIKAVEKRINDLEQEQAEFEEDAGNLLGVPCSEWLREHL
jgi:hypothetical protein